MGRGIIRCCGENRWWQEEEEEEEETTAHWRQPSQKVYSLYCSAVTQCFFGTENQKNNKCLDVLGVQVPVEALL